jgi:hypothetical protein
MANRRFIDFPIASTVGDNDIVLIWQDGLNKQTTKGTLIQGAPTSLEGLTDVDIAGLINGQILQYNSVTGKWENVDRTGLNLSELGDVSIVSPSNGQVLVYNSTTSKWENSSAGFVPYVGAVTTVDLGAQGLRAGYVRFNTSVVSVPNEQGLMYWDGDDETIAVILNGYIMKIGEDQFYPVKNQTGSSIAKGTAVRFAGTVGASGRLLIAPFIADGSVSSSFFMGVTAEAIADGADGKVLYFGRIRGINTNAFNEGDVLYASTTVAGGFQTAVPLAPNNIVQVAAVINKSINQGVIFIRPSFGSNINQDEGVKIVSPTTGQLLQLQANGLWENKTTAQVLGGTSSQFVKGDGTLDSNTYQVTSEKGQPNGYASLDSNGKVPLVQINDALIGNVNFQGLWNASTNTPTLANPPASGTKGYYYIVSTAGTFASISFEVGDWIISDGTAWGKVDNTDAVSSVFGRTGNVTAANGDYTTAQVTESGNLYYTDGRARGALSFVAGSGAYNSTTGVITIPTNNNQITNGAGYITSAALSGYLPLTGGTMTGPIITPNGTFGIIVGDDSRLADRNIANTLFLEGVQNNDRGYINFSQTTGNALGAINGGDLTWRGNSVVTGTGASGTIPIFTGSTSIGNSIITASASLMTVTSNTDGQIIQMARNGGAYAWKLGIDSSSFFNIYNNSNVSYLRINPDNGNVGIGTDTPIVKLHVTDKSLVRTGDSAWGQFAVANPNDSEVGITWGAGGTGYPGITSTYTRQWIAGLNPFGTGTDRWSLTNKTLGANTAITVLEGGNVGIGTTGPSFKLQVNGEGRFYQSATNTTAYLRVENNRSRNAAIRLTTTVGDYYLGVGIGADVNQFQIFDGIAGATRLTISSTGEATFTNYVNVSRATDSVVFLNTTGTNQASCIVTQQSGTNKWAFGTNLGAGDDSWNVYNYSAASRYLTITSGGNVLIGTTTDNGDRLQVSSPGYGIVGINRGATNTSAGNSYYSVTSFRWFSGIYENSDNFGVYSAGTGGFPLILNYGTGAATFSNLSGSGNRIVVANSGGTLISAVIGSGLAFDGTTLTATGGASGSISGSGDSGTIALFTGTSSIGNSVITQSSGNIGINISSPQAKSHVANLTLDNSPYQHIEYLTANNSTEASGESYSGQASYGIGFRRQWTSSTFTNMAGIYAFGSGGWRGGLLFRTKNNTNSTGEPDVNALFLSPIGNVGIGTTSPSEILHLNKTSGTGTFIRFQDTGGGGVYIGGRSEAMELYAGGSEAMRITSGRNVLIGTQTDNGNKLRVNGTIFSDSSVTATSFFESSDATIKTLIEDAYQAKGIDSVVAKLYMKNGKQELGYYAQDLQSVLPSAVSKGSNGLLNLSYREVHTAKIAYLEQRIKQLENELLKPS